MSTLNNRVTTTISEYDKYFMEQQAMQSSESKSFHDEIGKYASELPISHQSFCKMFYDITVNTSLNQRTISILNNYTQKYLPNNQQYQISINNKTPIAQFLVDTYFQCVLRDNLTINEFMKKSKFLSSIPCNSKPWQIIRRHLSDYTKYMHQPINGDFLMDSHHDDDDEDDDDEYEDGEGVIGHNMNRILFYTAKIHDSLRVLTKVSQIDMIFIPQIISSINGKYFDNLGIKYRGLRDMDPDCHQYGDFLLMLRNFNASLPGQRKRCILLVMSDGHNVSKDKVYTFESVENNALPPEIAEYTEIPFIVNSKSDEILPSLSLNEYNGLSLSIHRHNNAERVYFRYKSYGTRVFKHNLKSVLEPFCSTQYSPQFDWNCHVKNKEFKDPQYNAFINTYFADLELIKPDLLDYFVECAHSEDSRWSMQLYHYMTIDNIDNNKDYTYKPSHYQQYQQINKITNQYYKSVGCNLRNKFIKFIDENDFFDYPLEDNLGPNVDPADCTLIGFDKEFPIDHFLFDIQNDKQRDEYMFYFIQHCYLFGRAPKPEYMMSKWQKRAQCKTISNLPGNYCYQTKHEQEGEKYDVKIIVYGDDNSNNNSHNSSNNKNNANSDRNNKEPHKNNNNNSRQTNNGANNSSNDGSNDGSNDEDEEKKDKNNDKDNNKNNDKNDGRKGRKNKRNKSKKEDDNDPKSLYRIPWKLSKTTIPSMITEQIPNIFDYMIDSLRLLSINKGIYELTNGDRIIDFDFHHKDTPNVALYCIAQKTNGERGYKWIFNDGLYTAEQIQKQYGIDCNKLPKSPKSQIPNHKSQIVERIIKTKHNIIQQTKWAKKTVYNNTNNKKRITLSLTQPMFIEHIKKYNDMNNMEAVDLLPIIRYDKQNKYWLEYVWIISIEESVDVGIAFKYQSNDDIKVTEIYFDKELLLSRHILMSPNHKCHCLDNRFKSEHITYLEIGNVAEKENKLKALRNRYDGVERENASLKQENSDLKNENIRLKVNESEFLKEMEKWKTMALTLKKQLSDIQTSDHNKQENNQEMHSITNTKTADSDSTPQHIKQQSIPSMPSMIPSISIPTPVTLQYSFSSSVSTTDSIGVAPKTQTKTGDTSPSFSVPSSQITPSGNPAIPSIPSTKPITMQHSAQMLPLFTPNIPTMPSIYVMPQHPSLIGTIYNQQNIITPGAISQFPMFPMIQPMGSLYLPLATYWNVVPLTTTSNGILSQPSFNQQRSIDIDINIANQNINQSV